MTTRSPVPVNYGNVTKALSAVSSRAHGAAGSLQEADAAVSGNGETSRLGGLEFNTPYAHQIVALAAVLAVVATVSIALAVKFTRVSSSHSDDEEDDNRKKTGWECAPILSRLGGSGKYSYESLRQVDSHRRCPAVFCFGARLDGANGLLCIHGMRVWLRETDDNPTPMDGWGIAIDIVTQTEVECRQTRVQTRLVASSGDEDSGDDDAASLDADAAADLDEVDGATPRIVESGGWSSEPLDDVLTVRLNRNETVPLKGQLLIRVLVQQPPPEQSEWNLHQLHQMSMVKIGGVNFPLDRIQEPNVACISVALKKEVK